MKNFQNKVQSVIEKLDISKDDMYKNLYFESKTRPDGTETGQMQSIVLKGLIEDKIISIKILENTDYFQVIKYDKKAKKENFVNISYRARKLDKLKNYLAMREIPNKRDSFTIEDFISA